ncbi:hypothetical protein [Cytophaga aurantiaca]|uniref:hypothetical protein n=1 Tax=Cytophaga aurantiaca TaxID=29530 RepID=UPI00035DD7FA|nr:hypothetical protein [Cytophaga aurantiaca]
MKIKFLFILFTLTLLVGFINKHPLIYSDRSSYNGLKIDSSTLKDVEKIYGFDYEVNTWTTTVVVGTKEGESIPINKINYPQQGISFIILAEDINKANLHTILFTYPFKAGTDKGITIGKSTFADVTKLYGEGYWSAGNNLDSKKLSLSYGTITFRTDKFFSEEEFKNMNKDIFSKLIVTEIALESMNY